MTPVGQNPPEEETVAEVSTWFWRSGSELRQRSQWVIDERPVTLYVNDHELVTLLCTGRHLEELAIGFAYAEGIIEDLSDLVDIDVDQQRGWVRIHTTRSMDMIEKLWGKRTITSGCGKGSIFYHALDALLARPVTARCQVPCQRVWDRMTELNRMSRVYKRTHGVHNCALATDQRIHVFRDDIGRHNAVDMLVGHALLHQLPLEEMMLLTTGRLTSEILLKAAKVGISILVSRNTATTLAIRLAHELRLTLIGYARASSFTIYSGPERILASRGKT